MSKRCSLAYSLLFTLVLGWPPIGFCEPQAEKTVTRSHLGSVSVDGTAGFPFGPYLMGNLPTNPYNGGNGISVKAAAISTTDVDPTAVQGAVKVGWIYSTLTGQVIANSIGSAADGTALSAL